MKAIYYTEYGGTDVLELKDVEIPTPKENEVLVKVHAASINSWDWDMVRGKPIFARLWGLFKPKYHIPGADIAGEVEEVGEKVTRFKPGDKVYGDLCDKGGWGGFAQYVCAPDTALLHKPKSMNYEEAAAVPQAAAMAVQGLRDIRMVKKGEKVLINGAAGAVGTFAIQLAKYYGAKVTGVDATEKLDLMRSLGADHVVDYKNEDFTKNGVQYDLIFDVTAQHPISDYKRALAPDGVYVMVGGEVKLIFHMMLMGPLMSLFSKKKMCILGVKPNVDLDVITDLFEMGEVVPVIEKCYPLSETPEAIQRLADGRSMGKLVITIKHDE